MARFRLSTDILSPLNSDISLNDVSAYSFGSLPDAPVFDSSIASPLYCANSKEKDIRLLHSTKLKDCVSPFDDVTKTIKKHSSLNSETEEECQSTYEELKKSMDDLFGKDSYSPILPSQLKTKLNSENHASINSEINTIGKFQNSKNQKFLAENQALDSENISEITKVKSEKYTNKKSIMNKLKKSQHQSKQTASASESLKGTKNKNELPSSSESLKGTKNKNEAPSTSALLKGVKNKNETCIKTDTSVDKKKNALIDKKTNSKAISKSGGASCNAKEPSSKKVPEKKDNKKSEDIRGYNFKCHKKIPVSGVKPVIESKGLSIEKSIQLAVNMEMDNIHRFVLNQNILMRKGLRELQEKAKEQDAITEYLFSVIDELLDTNKQLISKCK